MITSFSDVMACVDRFQKVVIPDDTYDRISDFVVQVCDAKATEHHHVIDPFSVRKRFLTGFLGEAALEILLGIRIIDWSIGNSVSYHVPDIPGFSVGIKTVQEGKFPIIFKSNFYPQIMCIRSVSEKRVVYVCGLATVDVLNSYQNDNLILDPLLRRRGTKTGFYGFDHLIRVSKISDISIYRKH